MANWRMAVHGGLHDGAVIDLPDGRYSIGRDAEQAQIVMSDPGLPAHMLDIQVSASRVFFTLPGLASAVGAAAQSPLAALPLEIKVLGRVLSSRGKVIMASAAPHGHAAVVQLTSHLSLHLSSDWVLPEKKGGLRLGIYGLVLGALVFGAAAWWYDTSAPVSASMPQKPLPIVDPPAIQASVIPVSTTDAVLPLISSELTPPEVPAESTKLETMEALPVVDKAEQKPNAVSQTTANESQTMGSYVVLGVVSVGSMDLPGLGTTASDALQEPAARRGRQWYLELADRTRVYEGGSLPTGQVFVTVDKRQRLWVVQSDGRRVFYSLR